MSQRRTFLLSQRLAFLATVTALVASCRRWMAGSPAPPSGSVAPDPLRTALCRDLGIDYPIFSVGFGESSVPELAAAVSRAGGCGVLGSGGGMPLAEIHNRIRCVRELTDRPFGVDFIIAALEQLRVVRSRAEDTFYGTLFDAGWPDAPHRALRNKVYAEWEAAGRPPAGKRPGEGTSIGRVHHAWGVDEEWLRYEPGMIVPGFDGDPDYAPMWAGESCSLVRDVRPAAEIVRDLVREARQALGRT